MKFDWFEWLKSDLCISYPFPSDLKNRVYEAHEAGKNFIEFNNDDMNRILAWLACNGNKNIKKGDYLFGLKVITFDNDNYQK